MSVQPHLVVIIIKTIITYCGEILRKTLFMTNAKLKASNPSCIQLDAMDRLTCSYTFPPPHMCYDSC